MDVVRCYVVHLVAYVELEDRVNLGACHKDIRGMFCTLAERSVVGTGLNELIVDRAIFDELTLQMARDRCHHLVQSIVLRQLVGGPALPTAAVGCHTACVGVRSPL